MKAKSNRICKCGLVNNNIYPVCNACRAEGCEHKDWHYDSCYAVVCDYCGTVMAAHMKKRSANNVRGVHVFGNKQSVYTGLQEG
jgi:predicted sulfurtransferase